MRLSICRAALALALLAASRASADDVSFRDVPGTEGRWQEAAGIVDAAPRQVRAWMTDYRRWPALYQDVSAIEVQSDDGQVAVLRFHSRIFGRAFTIQVRRTHHGLVYAGRQGSIHTEGKVWLSDAGRGRTSVIIQSYAHVGGFIGAFVSRGTIRGRQRQKLGADLADLQRAARRALAARR